MDIIPCGQTPTSGHELFIFVKYYNGETHWVIRLTQSVVVLNELIV